MLPIRWQSLNEVRAEMRRVQDEMSRMFGRPGANGGRETNGAAIFPPLNVWEDAQALHLEAELPGLDLQDLEISVDGENHLTIQGERKQPTIENGQWHRTERAYGKFQRVFDLPPSVDPEKVEAEFKLGVLTITLPKRETMQPRRVQVKAN